MLENIRNFFWGKPRFSATVCTGDRSFAGTDSTVWLQLIDSLGKISTKTRLDKFFVNDHERDETGTYDVYGDGLERPHEIASIIVYRDKTIIHDDQWLLDKIVLTDLKEDKTYVFPVQRWIKADQHYYLFEFDAFLPQEDKQSKERRVELERKRMVYEYEYNQTFKGGPKLLQDVPADESYSFFYVASLKTLQALLTAGQIAIYVTTWFWSSLSDLKNIYLDDSHRLKQPLCVDFWAQDRWFGLQRVQGVCAGLITLCKEIPPKLGVSATDLEPFLEGLNLNDALSKNRIFIVDLEILNRVFTNSKLGPDQMMVAPIGLFYLNKKDELMPIAIQLFQEPSPTNPVFFSSDSHFTWIVAKMFFNMGETQVHQSCIHLCQTHLLMETMCVSANRNLSQSHPIFRLLAPHFLYLLATNEKGVHKLLDSKGWMDECMTAGSTGATQLVIRAFRKWKLGEDGDFEKQIENRGVLDPNILPYYPYRDDGVPLYNAIKKYVTRVVHYFYDTQEKLLADQEVKSWVSEMATSQSLGGCGIGGIPEKLENIDQLAEICTVMISSCSMGHAAVNYQQYENYGFVPNYPAILSKMPPQHKYDMTEEDLMKYIPDKKTTLNIMLVTKILSTNHYSTKSLGDFPVQYLFNPAVIEIAQEFREELKKVSQETKMRNHLREFKYECLDPELVTNSICI